MRHLAFTLLLAGCGKSDSKDPAPAKAEPPSFADVKGVVITGTDVLLDGKSLGVLPARLVEDRSVLATGLRAAAAPPNRPVALSYTDDAPAPVVLAAMRAVGEALPTAPPPEPESGSATGTAMALDEGKMGKVDSRAQAIEAARAAGVLGSPGAGYSISVLGSGKPKKVCDARAVGAAADDERVDLSVKVGANGWQVAVSRVNEIESVESIAKVGDKLKEYKQSAFFADRNDVELAAEPGATGAALTPVLAAACATGFFEIRPITVEELAAQLAPSPAGPRRSEPRPAAAVPTMSIGQPNAQGDLDKAVIRRYIKRNASKLSYCYERELLAKPALSGTVAAQFFIGADGLVVSSAASGVDPAVATCVADVIKAIEFPRPKDGGGVQVNYPFTFFKPAAAPAAKP